MKNILTTIAATVVASTTLSVAISATNPAYGASLRYISPMQSQLDNDLIDDIAVNVGDPVNFVLELDTTGLDANLVSLSYVPIRDGNELELIANPRTGEALNLFPDFSLERVTDPDTGQVTVTVTESGDTGVAPDTIVILREIEYTALPGITNDGLSDLRISEVTEAIDANGNNVTALFTPTPSDGADVQPVPEPATIFGMGFALITMPLLKKARSKN